MNEMIDNDKYSLCLPDIKVFKEEGSWSYCIRPPRLAQGWKIYISNTIHTMRHSLAAVANYLAGIDMPFKFIRDRSTLEFLNSGLSGYSQIGKSIVIYAEHGEREIMLELSNRLESGKWSTPAIPFAIPMGNGLPLYYRFGAYRDFTLQIEGNLVPDHRTSKEFAVPDGICDIFKDLVGTQDDDSSADRLLARFPVIQTVSQTGKSGVFLGLDTNDQALAPVVVKIGYQHGAIQGSSLDGCEYARREILNYERIVQDDLAENCPKLICQLDSINTVILVIEYILGADLSVEMKINEIALESIVTAWGIMAEFHKKGYILTDPKLSNFVREADTGRIYAVDLEMIHKPGDKKVGLKSTFHMERESKYSAQTRDKIHFISSVLLSDRPSLLKEQKRTVKLDRLYAAAKTLKSLEIASWTLNELQKIEASL